MLRFSVYFISGLITFVGLSTGFFLLGFVPLIGPILLIVAAYNALSRPRLAARIALWGVCGVALVSLPVVVPNSVHAWRAGYLPDKKAAEWTLLLVAVAAYSLPAAFRKDPAPTWFFPERATKVTRVVAILCGASVLTYGIGSFLRSATRTVHVPVPMTWECAPDENRSWAPEAQHVRFRFLENPHYVETVAGRGLCDQLRSYGKNIVSVEFEVDGNFSRGVTSYNEVSVDGRRIVVVGGFWHSGVNGDPREVGPFPLNKFFK